VPPSQTPLTEKDIARRDEVEQKMLRGEYLHDGPFELQVIGDINSVPALLVVLQKNPPHKNGTMVCTTAHGLAALRKITGAYPGSRYEEWQAWWEKYQVENELPKRR
jgi:hypothetical protein